MRICPFEIQIDTEDDYYSISLLFIKINKIRQGAFFHLGFGYLHKKLIFFELDILYMNMFTRNY